MYITYIGSTSIFAKQLLGRLIKKKCINVGLTSFSDVIDSTNFFISYSEHRNSLRDFENKADLLRNTQEI